MTPFVRDFATNDLAIFLVEEGQVGDGRVLSGLSALGELELKLSESLLASERATHRLEAVERDARQRVVERVGAGLLCAGARVDVAVVAGEFALLVAAGGLFARGLFLHGSEGRSLAARRIVGGWIRRHRCRVEA